MVTITTASDDKEKGSNCVTPKKKAANNTTTAAASADSAVEQTAPNILVYKKVRNSYSLKIFKFTKFIDTDTDGSDCGEDASWERWSVSADS